MILQLPVRKSNLFIGDLAEFRIGDRFGAGSCGTVFQVTCNQCTIPLVAKLVDIDPNSEEKNINSFKLECHVSEIMGDAGIGPQIVAWVILHESDMKNPVGILIMEILIQRVNIKNPVGILIMERLDYSLNRYFHSMNFTNLQDILDLLEIKIQQMFDLGFGNYDLCCQDNIMVNVNKKLQVVNVYIIDWGLAEVGESDHSAEHLLEILKIDLAHV